MTLKTEDLYNGKNGMTYVRTDAGGIALTDEIKKLYGMGTGDIDSQYALATGTNGDSVSTALVEQYAAALKDAQSAKTNAALASLSSAAAASDLEYDEAAKQLYAQKMLSERAMANNLASAGLYNSGYSDSARIALENNYASNLAQSENARKATAEKYRLEGVELLSELGAANAEIDAEAAQMALQQLNSDRNYALEAQKYADSRSDAEREYALQLQKYTDERNDVLRNFELAEEKYADTRADIEYERAVALNAAEDKRVQQAIENAYAAAEMGDFSLLEALGIDTTSAKAAYDAELELLVLKLNQARSEAAGNSVTSGTGENSVSSSSSKKGNTSSSSSPKTETKKDSESSGNGIYEAEFATEMANKLVSNMRAQNKSYSEVLDYIGSIKNGVIKQYGQEFWDKYVEVISKTYPGGSGYKEPEHLSSMESVMAFIKDSRNSSRFFTDDGYNLNAIRQLINNADLSEAERRELRAYYGIATSSGGGKIGQM